MNDNNSLARRGAWFGLLAAASSSPGQTFFIGLFGAAFRENFGLTAAELGSLYGVATLASGLLMFWLGELADRLALRRAITLSVGLVVLGGATLASASAPIQLGLGLFLLRLGGQGLTGHFAIVAAARFSTTRRGAGIATAAMGFILGEAFYPLLVTAALGVADWRTVWISVAVLLAIVYLPALRVLARPFPLPEAQHVATSASDGEWTRRRLLLSPPFLGALGVVLIPPFALTGVFFHQTTLAGRFGWSPENVAQAFVVFAVCQAFATLLAGRLVDSFGARTLLRFYLLPLGAGLLALLVASPQAALWLLFAGLGFSGGGNSVVAGAVWVEIFGASRLGMIRGVYAALMVIATGAAPALLGALLSAGVSLPAIFLPVVAYAALAPWLLAPLTRQRNAVD